LVKAREGKAGSVIRTWRITYKDEQVVSKELLKEEKVDPKPTLFLMSRAGFETSRGAFMRSKVLSMRATAYDPSPATIGRGATGRAANGMRAAYGIVAVDPRVIPLGSLVYVEGYGFAIAADTGGAIKGNRIDLCYNSRHEACCYGSHRVRVHILKPR
jgi:3D (Asp-Asp-Asp) domain-containing protein